MVDQIAIVPFTTAGTGTLDITSPLITDTFSAAIFIYSTSESDDTDNLHGAIGFGFCAPDAGDSPTVTGNATAVQLASARTSTQRTDNNSAHANGNCISVLNGATTVVEISGSFNAAIAGGVRLNITQGAGGKTTKGIAILFAGLARAYTDTGTATTLGQHENVGQSTKFRPNLVIFTTSVGAVNVTTADGSLQLGFALDDGGSSQISAMVNHADNVTTTDADGALRSAKCIEHLPPAHASKETATIVIDATGFTATSSAGSPDFQYLALKFTAANVRLAIANIAVSGSAGLQTFNDFGFTPEDLVFGMSTLLGSVDSDIDGATAGCEGIFAFDGRGTQARAYTCHMNEGVVLGNPSPTTNAHSRQGNYAVLTYDHTGAVAQQATYAGPSGAGGFALNFSTATAGFLTALGIQIVPNPPQPVLRPRRRRRQRRQRARRLPVIFTHAASQVLVRGGRARLRARMRRAVRALRRSRRFVTGKPAGGAPPLTRLLRAVGRYRRKMRARLLWRARPVQTEIPPTPVVLTDPPTGKVAQPGMVRGRIVGASIKQGEAT